MSTTYAPEQQLAYIAANIDDLRKMAARQDEYAVEIDTAFGNIADALWELDGSDAPRYLLNTLDNLGLRTRFDEWADREGRELPSPQAGWHIRWVI